MSSSVDMHDELRAQQISEMLRKIDPILPDDISNDDAKVKISLEKAFCDIASFSANHWDALTNSPFVERIKKAKDEGLVYFVAMTQDRHGNVRPFDGCKFTIRMLSTKKSSEKSLLESLSNETMIYMRFPKTDSPKSDSPKHDKQGAEVQTDIVFKLLGSIEKIKKTLAFQHLIGANNPDYSVEKRLEFQYRLGISYEKGQDGVKHSLDKAFKAYIKAAEGEHYQAMMAVSDILACGGDDDGELKPSFEQAYQWALKASTHREAPKDGRAFITLAQHHLLGVGGKKINFQEAMKFLDKIPNASDSRKIRDMLRNTKPRAVNSFSMGEAIRHGYLETLQSLVEQKCNVNSDIMDGPERVKPLLLTIRHQQVPILKYLLEHKASVNIQDSKKRTPLHFSVVSFSPKAVEVVRHLLGHGADLEARDSLSNTPLLTAYKYFSGVVDRQERFSNHQFAMVEYLLECGVDFKVGNKDHETIEMLTPTRDRASIKNLFQKALVKRKDEIKKWAPLPSVLLEMIIEYDHHRLPTMREDEILSSNILPPKVLQLIGEYDPILHTRKPKKKKTT